ncbi:hypothetical protein [Planktothrix sp.]
MTESQLANLKICHRKVSDEPRTVHASARLRPTTKKELQEKLNQLKMNLADFLEVVADSDSIEMIKSDGQHRVVVKSR